MSVFFCVRYFYLSQIRLRLSHARNVLIEIINTRVYTLPIFVTGSHVHGQMSQYVGEMVNHHVGF